MERIDAERGEALVELIDQEVAATWQLLASSVWWPPHTPGFRSGDGNSWRWDRGRSASHRRLCSSTAHRACRTAEKRVRAHAPEEREREIRRVVGTQETKSEVPSGGYLTSRTSSGKSPTDGRSSVFAVKVARCESGSRLPCARAVRAHEERLRTLESAEPEARGARKRAGEPQELPSERSDSGQVQWRRRNESPLDLFLLFVALVHVEAERVKRAFIVITIIGHAPCAYSRSMCTLEVRELFRVTGADRVNAGHERRRATPLNRGKRCGDYLGRDGIGNGVFADGGRGRDHQHISRTDLDVYPGSRPVVSAK
ncbi:hypothetical protein BH11MYX1_BH11MYX1_04860 [soil metagenome]